MTMFFDAKGHHLVIESPRGVMKEVLLLFRLSFGFGCIMDMSNHNLLN